MLFGDDCRNALAQLKLIRVRYLRFCGFQSSCFNQNAEEAAIYLGLNTLKTRKLVFEFCFCIQNIK